MNNPVVTLSGSPRFEPWFHTWNLALSLAGYQVFSLASFASAMGAPGIMAPEDKAALDDVTMSKIDGSQHLVVLNAFGYIGDSTWSEIQWAESLGVEVRYLETWDENIDMTASSWSTQWRAAAKRYGIPDGYHTRTETSASAWPLLRRRGTADARSDRFKAICENGSTAARNGAPVGSPWNEAVHGPRPRPAADGADVAGKTPHSLAKAFGKEGT
jgi:hypothetical protein